MYFRRRVRQVGVKMCNHYNDVQFMSKYFLVHCHNSIFVGQDASNSTSAIPTSML